MWTEFIDKAVYQKVRINVPYEEDIRYILKNIKDSKTRREIISSLMKIKDYNPFADKLPTKNYPNLCKKL